MKEMESKPFTMLGVDSDSPEKLKSIIANGTVTWKCFSDGDPPGPIARAWNVHAWPSIYVIDKKGIIRMKGHGQDPKPLLDKLVAEEP
ncbi:MAG TPA: redoxin domain-containing protein [Chroococcales cyanobacterium]